MFIQGGTFIKESRVYYLYLSGSSLIVVSLNFFCSCQHFHTNHSYPFKASEKMKAIGLVANWELGRMTPESIEKATEEIITKYDKAYNCIGQVSTAYPAKIGTIKKILCCSFFLIQVFI